MAGRAVPAWETESMLHHIPRTNWSELLASFSSRNSGRRTRLDIDDLDLGAAPRTEEHAFVRVAFDRSSDSIRVVLDSAPAPGRVSASDIHSPRAVDILTDRYGRDRALRIEHGRSQTVLLFVE